MDPDVAYFMQFANDHLPSLPPSSRELTRVRLEQSLNAVQNRLWDAEDAAKRPTAVPGAADAAAALDDRGVMPSE